MSDDKPSRLRRWSDLSVTLAIIVAASAVTYRAVVPFPSVVEGGPAGVPVPAKPIAVGDVVAGFATARAVLVEFTDFECPYCGRFSTDILPDLKREYVDKGLLRVAVRHLPLEQIHANARAAAELAVCANERGVFWNVHDLFFKARPLSPTVILDASKQLGLTGAELDSCRAGRAKATLEADAILASNLGISSTPTFLIGLSVGRDGTLVQVAEVIQGARSIDIFRKAISGVLSDNGR